MTEEKTTKQLKTITKELKTITKDKETKVVTKPQSEFDPYQIIKYPLSTEKSIRQIEFDNKLIFIVDKKATKPQIKQAIEQLFNVKVIKVNTQNTFKGNKKAYIQLSPDSLASDVSADLGLI